MKAYKPIAREAAPPQQLRPESAAASAIVAIVDDRMDPSFMDGLAQALQGRLPAATIRQWAKPAGTSPAPEPLIREVAGVARAAVVGIGA